MRAVIADEWSVLRNGVAAVLAQCGITVVAQVGAGVDVMAAVETHSADVVVIGTLPDASAVAVVERSKRRHPPLRSLVLLDVVARDTALALLDAGAEVVVARDTSETDLRDAAARLVRGERHIAPAILAAAFGSGTVRAPRDSGLTDRERAVLRHLVDGRSNREIAAALFIGESTVKSHLRNIYEKLGVTNRVQAVGAVIERELLRP